MAIDTLQKRRSSLYSLMPFFTPSVSIDGSMSQADRQESAWAYSGILATDPFQTVTLLSAVVTQPAIVASIIQPGIAASVVQPGITPSVTQPGATASITQPTITIDEKNDIR